MIENALPIRCLIVDDDEDDQEILSTAMAKSILAPTSFTFATDGEEALERLHNDTLPDYIFLDLNMPRMDGMECLSAIRKTEKLQRIPVVIYSTSNDDYVKAEAIGLGATAFISKPTKFSDLVNSLDTFFTAHNLSQVV